jgi:hypothetical protein
LYTFLISPMHRNTCPSPSHRHDLPPLLTFYKNNFKWIYLCVIILFDDSKLIIVLTFPENEVMHMFFCFGLWAPWPVYKYWNNLAENEVSSQSWNPAVSCLALLFHVCRDYFHSLQTNFVKVP